MNTTAPNQRSLVRRNGTTEQLPEHGQKMVEAGLSLYQKVVTERDDLDRRLREASMELEGMRVQLNSLKSVVNMMESSYNSVKVEAEGRIRQHQLERDKAVGTTAALDAVLLSVHNLIGSALDGFERERDEQSK